MVGEAVFPVCFYGSVIVHQLSLSVIIRCSYSTDSSERNLKYGWPSNNGSASFRKSSAKCSMFRHYSNRKHSCNVPRSLFGYGMELLMERLPTHQQKNILDLVMLLGRKLLAWSLTTAERNCWLTDCSLLSSASKLAFSSSFSYSPCSSFLHDL